jgi:hypothetical protein
MIKNCQKFLQTLSNLFEQQMATYWANLSRTNNLFVILNISFFFVTELVTKEGYYYTYYSLFLLLIVQMGLLLPLGLLNRLWYYCIYLMFEILAIYYVIASVWFWVATNKT